MNTWFKYKKWLVDFLTNSKEKVIVNKINETSIVYTYENKKNICAFDEKEQNAIKKKMGSTKYAFVYFEEENRRIEHHLIIEYKEMLIDFLVTTEKKELKILFLNDNGKLGLTKLIYQSLGETEKSELIFIIETFIECLGDIKEYRLFIVTGLSIQKPGFL